MEIKQLTSEWWMYQREKNQDRNQNIPELSQNAKQQNPWGTLKAALREIFIALSAYTLNN